MTEGGFDPASLVQSWPKPSKPRPIVTFGAGSIVGDAHFPAYRKAGFPVIGLYDPDHARAARLADQWGVTAFRSAEEAASVEGAIFDLATPPSRHADVLKSLPDGAVALIQKPMGSNLAEATTILEICRAKKLHAAVNFQLRFAPMMLALKDAIAKGWLGEIVDFDAWLAVATPWELWEFLLKAPRVEIAMHSIHYLDLIRQLLGDPRRCSGDALLVELGVFAHQEYACVERHRSKVGKASADARGRFVPEGRRARFQRAGESCATGRTCARWKTFEGEPLQREA